MDFEITSFLSVILSLVIVEVLLSVDNALVNASLAQGLPHEQRARAVRIGIMFGALFRIVALLTVTIIIKNIWLKTIGALYLIYLAINHIGVEKHPIKSQNKKERAFNRVILHIALADLAFGIDNVITAVGLSDNTTYVIIGVLIGIAAMIFLSPKMLPIIDRFPSLEVAAYVIVGVIGVFMLIENFTHLHIVEYQKFLAVLGIMLFTVAYERSPRLKSAVRPTFHKIQIFFGWIADFLQALLQTLLLFRKIRVTNR